jgi:prepilin-type N-terminal cleavage/methylation domain-containing protein
MSTTKRSADLKLSLRGTRSGYTLIELLIVMVIATILMSMAIPQFTRMLTTRNAQNARDDLVWMAVRAKAKAVERGQTYLLEINPNTERAWIVRRNPTTAADTIQTVDFSTEFKATISTSANTTITVCYSPRGFAFSCAGAASPSSDTDVTFTHGDKTATARIRPLGQVIRI